MPAEAGPVSSTEFPNFRGNTAVIASEAKQSTKCMKSRRDCLVAPLLAVTPMLYFYLGIGLLVWCRAAIQSGQNIG
jgi:hypothetical protein